MDYYYFVTSKKPNEKISNFDFYGKISEMNNFQEKDYSLYHYIIYQFYPLLWISGPICSFNAFLFLIENNCFKNYTEILIDFSKSIFYFLCVEFSLHKIYAVRLLTSILKIFIYHLLLHDIYAYIFWI